ncbi:MAG: hypothetical protein IJL69_06935, partial [Oscillospiraceae bacterium]|nr:hypothetical protein [Oscillospiraceae bacterium]
MARCDAKELYIRRVLREVRRHSGDRWIDGEIRAELEARFAGRDAAEVLRELPSARAAGLQYRLRYADSAAEPDGFTPHVVRRLIRNLAAPAVELLAALCVFRLFPTTEYTAYAVCALAAVAAAVQQHVCFCRLRYQLVAMIAPVFLLIWYPARASAAAAADLSGFFRLLFSENHRHALILILIFTAFYALTTALLHAREYADRPLRPVVTVLVLLAAVGSVGGFAAYEVRRTRALDAESAAVLARLSSDFADGLARGDLTAARADARDADALARRNYHVYVKLDQDYAQDVSRFLALLDDVERARTGGSVQALFDRYFAGFDETDPRPLDRDRIFAAADYAADRFRRRADAADGGIASLCALSQTAG